MYVCEGMLFYGKKIWETLLIKRHLSQDLKEEGEGMWKHLGENVPQRIGSAKDSNEKHAWCAERIRLHEARRVGWENGKKNEVKKIAGK